LNDFDLDKTYLYVNKSDLKLSAPIKETFLLTRKTSEGALPVVAGAIRLVVVFYQAYCGRHPLSAER
jgi:hypothetical protein